MLSSQKDVRSTHGYYEDNSKFSTRPENETKLLNTTSNIQQIDTTIVGRKNTRPQFSLSIPLHHSMNHPRHMQKGEPLLCSPTFSATFLNKNGGLCKKNNGHQTLAYLLLIMTNILETMFQHVATTLMPVGEITTEHRRSR